jgi:tyrosinase
VKSPVFDSSYSLGGNGPLIAGNASNNGVPGRTGGGCLENGPFVNKTVHLGPFAFLERNDQCLKRDLAPEYAATYLAGDKLTIVMSQTNYGWFERTLEGGTAFGDSQIHTGGK